MNILIGMLSVFSILIYYFLTFCCVGRYFFSGLIVFVPIAILLFLKRAEKEEELSNKAIAGIAIAIMLLYFIGMRVGVVPLLIAEGTTVVENIHEYKRLVNFEPTYLTYYFPKKIPKTAENVKFHYHPQFLQGGMELRVEFDDSKENIDAYIEKYKDDYIEIINRAECSNSKFEALELFHYGFDINENYEDVTLYVILSEPGNHGERAFIAVNNEHTRILFQSERW